MLLCSGYPGSLSGSCSHSCHGTLWFRWSPGAPPSWPNTPCHLWLCCPQGRDLRMDSHRRQEWPGQASHRPNITSSAATVPSPPCGLKTRPSAQGQAGRALESTWGGRGHCQNPRNFAGLGKAGAGSKASCKGGDEIECGTQSEEPDCCTKPGL